MADFEVPPEAETTRLYAGLQLQLGSQQAGLVAQRSVQVPSKSSTRGGDMVDFHSTLRRIRDDVAHDASLSKISERIGAISSELSQLSHSAPLTGHSPSLWSPGGVERRRLAEQRRHELHAELNTLLKRMGSRAEEVHLSATVAAQPSSTQTSKPTRSVRELIGAVDNVLAHIHSASSSTSSSSAASSARSRRLSSPTASQRALSSSLHFPEQRTALPVSRDFEDAELDDALDADLLPVEQWEALGLDVPACQEQGLKISLYGQHWKAKYMRAKEDSDRAHALLHLQQVQYALLEQRVFAARAPMGDDMDDNNDDSSSDNGDHKSNAHSASGSKALSISERQELAKLRESQQEADAALQQLGQLKDMFKQLMQAQQTWYQQREELYSRVQDLNNKLSYSESKCDHLEAELARARMAEQTPSPSDPTTHSSLPKLDKVEETPASATELHQQPTPAKTPAEEVEWLRKSVCDLKEDLSAARRTVAYYQGREQEYTTQSNLYSEMQRENDMLLSQLARMRDERKGVSPRTASWQSLASSASGGSTSSLGPAGSSMATSDENNEVLARLQRKAERAERTANQLRSVNDLLRNKVEDANRSLNEHAETYEAMQNRYRGTITRLQDQMSGTHNTIEGLKERLRQVQQLHFDASAEATALKARVSLINEELRVVKYDRDQLHVQVLRLQDKLPLTSQLHHSRKTVSKLQADLSAMSGKYDAVKHELMLMRRRNSAPGVAWKDRALVTPSNAPKIQLPQSSPGGIPTVPVDTPVPSPRPKKPSVRRSFSSPPTPTATVQRTAFTGIVTARNAPDTTAPDNVSVPNGCANGASASQAPASQLPPPRHPVSVQPTGAMAQTAPPANVQPSSTSAKASTQATVESTASDVKAEHPPQVVQSQVDMERIHQVVKASRDEIEARQAQEVRLLSLNRELEEDKAAMADQLTELAAERDRLTMELTEARKKLATSAAPSSGSTSEPSASAKRKLDFHGKASAGNASSQGDPSHTARSVAAAAGSRQPSYSPSVERRLRDELQSVTSVVDLLKEENSILKRRVFALHRENKQSRDVRAAEHELLLQTRQHLLQAQEMVRRHESSSTQRRPGGSSVDSTPHPDQRLKEEIWTLKAHIRSLQQFINKESGRRHTEWTSTPQAQLIEQLQKAQQLTAKMEKDHRQRKETCEDLQAALSEYRLALANCQNKCELALKELETTKDALKKSETEKTALSRELRSLQDVVQKQAAQSAAAVTTTGWFGGVWGQGAGSQSAVPATPPQPRAHRREYSVTPELRVLRGDAGTSNAASAAPERSSPPASSSSQPTSRALRQAQLRVEELERALVAAHAQIQDKQATNYKIWSQLKSLQEEQKRAPPPQTPEQVRELRKRQAQVEHQLQHHQSTITALKTVENQLAKALSRTKTEQKEAISFLDSVSRDFDELREQEKAQQVQLLSKLRRAGALLASPPQKHRRNQTTMM